MTSVAPAATPAAGIHSTVVDKGLYFLQETITDNTNDDGLTTHRTPAGDGRVQDITACSM